MVVFRGYFDDPPSGQIVVQEASQNCRDVYYMPPEEHLIQATRSGSEISESGVRLLRLDNESMSVTVFPTVLRVSSVDYLGRKYD